MTRILKLDVTNFKRIKAVHIEPSGAIVEITGRNAQGKSSALDAICAALGGASLIPEQPVHNGERRASITVELGGDEVEMVVKRTWVDGRSSLTVEDAEGRPFPKAQTVLNAKIGALSFDPLAFTTMKPAEQVATLKAITGLDFKDLDDRDRELREQRTAVGREMKSLQGQLDGIERVPADVPDEETSLSDVQRRYEQALEQRDANQRKREELARVKHQRDGYLASVEDIRRQIEQLQQQLVQQEAQAAGANARIEQLDAEIAALVEPNIDAIKSEMESLDDRNRLVRQKLQRARVEQDAKATQREYDDLGDEIAAVKQQREKRLAEAEMPVEGLAFDESGVSYNGIAFSQASQAQQIRVSTAIASALNPDLKVMLIRNGSLMDADSRRLLAELAEQHGLQVWIETVTDGSGGGIVIEDGEVVANPQRETVSA